jgi:hypothetical protein
VLTSGAARARKSSFRRMLVVCAVLWAGAAGCWPYLPPPEPTITAVAKSRRPPPNCARLESMASLVPKPIDLDERCGHHIEDIDRYWCYQSELAYYAGNLRFWIDRAVSACANPDRP